MWRSVFETTQADRDAKEKELLKKDIKFTTKETLMFEYVNKFIHKHNLDWQKKEKSYMKSLLSQESGNGENPLENTSPDLSQEGEWNAYSSFYYMLFSYDKYLNNSVCHYCSFPR